MSDVETPRVSGIPAAGFTLVLATGVVCVFGYFAGLYSPIFLIAFAIYAMMVWSFVSAVRQWKSDDPATRPVMQFPLKSVFWTVLIIGGIALLIYSLLEGIGQAYRF